MHSFTLTVASVLLGFAEMSMGPCSELRLFCTGCKNEVDDWHVYLQVAHSELVLVPFSSGSFFEGGGSVKIMEIVLHFSHDLGLRVHPEKTQNTCVPPPAIPLVTRKLFERHLVGNGFPQHH